MVSVSTRIDGSVSVKREFFGIYVKKSANIMKT